MEGHVRIERCELGGGAVYDGEWCGEKPHGHGTLVDRRGNRFEGSFEHGRKVRGETKFRNGDFHAGPYEDNIREGKGTYVFHNGDRYEGDFAGGKLTGRGTFRWANGDLYTGAVQDGVPHGFGSKRMRNGDKFDGEWKAGKAHGWGRKVFVNGDMHEGMYERNERHGFGTYLWLNGDKYEGNFKHGKACGKGKRTANGVVAQGIFADDRLHGFARLTFEESGTVVSGSFVRGKRHGSVRVVWADGTRLVGIFENNKLKSGFKQFISGDTYDGQWKNSVAHGFGRKVFANGDTYQGDFQFDKRHGRGIYTWRGGARYEGGWSHSLEHGLATYVFPHGGMFRGNFDHGRKHGNCVTYVKQRGSIVRFLQVWSDGEKVAEHLLSPHNFVLFKPPDHIDNLKDFVDFFLTCSPHQVTVPLAQHLVDRASPNKYSSTTTTTPTRRPSSAQKYSPVPGGSVARRLSAVSFDDEVLWTSDAGDERRILAHSP